MPESSDLLSKRRSYPYEDTFGIYTRKHLAPNDVIYIFGPGHPRAGQPYIEIKDGQKTILNQAAVAETLARIAAAEGTSKITKTAAPTHPPLFSDVYYLGEMLTTEPPSSIPVSFRKIDGLTRLRYLGTQRAVEHIGPKGEYQIKKVWHEGDPTPAEYSQFANFGPPNMAEEMRNVRAFYAALPPAHQGLVDQWRAKATTSFSQELGRQTPSPRFDDQGEPITGFESQSGRGADAAEQGFSPDVAVGAATAIGTAIAGPAGGAAFGAGLAAAIKADESGSWSEGAKAGYEQAGKELATAGQNYAAEFGVDLSNVDALAIAGQAISYAEQNGISLDPLLNATRQQAQNGNDAAARALQALNVVRSAKDGSPQAQQWIDLALEVANIGRSIAARYEVTPQARLRLVR